MKQARVILATAIALAGRAALADGLVGTWTITTTNPEGPTVSELVLTKTEDGYTGVISGPRGTAELLSITRTPPASPTSSRCKPAWVL